VLGLSRAGETDRGGESREKYALHGDAPFPV